MQLYEGRTELSIFSLRDGTVSASVPCLGDVFRNSMWVAQSTHPPATWGLIGTDQLNLQNAKNNSSY
jgi:hypothetical protein